jgi:hypothetical protein
MKKVAACSVALSLIVAAGLVAAQNEPPAGGQAGGSAPPQTFTQAQLEQLVSPIALYPDALVSQILIASTYPIQVVEAYQWLQQHGKPSSSQIQQAGKAQGWDPSVQSMLSFPQLIDRMYQNLEWTQALGEAFLAQQKEVMSTIQAMRQKAYAAGNLKSSSQQTVTVQPDNTIVIVPAQPQVVYLPTYNPMVVYGAAWAPATWYYPPAVYAPWPGYNPAYASAVAFGAGVAVGAIWGSSYCSWSSGNVYVNNNYYAHGGTYDNGTYHGANGTVAHYGNTTAAYNSNTGHFESYNSATGETHSGQVYQGEHGTAAQGENGSVAHYGNTTAGYDKNTGQYASYNSATGQTHSGTVDHGADGGTAVQGSDGSVAHYGNTTAAYNKNTGQVDSYNSATGQTHSGNTNNAGSSSWQHDSAQRQGQPYQSSSLNQQYGGSHDSANRGWGEGGGGDGSSGWASRSQGFQGGDGDFDRAASDRGWASRGGGGGGGGFGDRFGGGFGGGDRFGGGGGGFARGGFRR